MDLLLEDFNADINQPFISYRVDKSGNNAFIYGRFIVYSDLFLKFRMPLYLVLSKNGNYIFARRIGIIEYYTPPSINKVLTGGILKGEKYGNITSVKQIDDPSFTYNFYTYPKLPQPI